MSRAALGARGRGEGGRRERERGKKKREKEKEKEEKEKEEERERAGGKFGGDRDGRSRVGDRQPRDAGWDGDEEKEGVYGWRKKKRRKDGTMIGTAEFSGKGIKVRVK